MILVTLGTQDKSFKRLLKVIEEQIKMGNINDDVIVQAGYTDYSSKHMHIFDYLPKDEFERLLKSCELLITHGGVGSILAGLNAQKKVIAVPRLKKYREHTNDHQLQIVKKLADEGYIIALDDLNDLESALKKAKDFKVKKYKSNTKNIISFLEEYIDSL